MVVGELFLRRRTDDNLVHVHIGRLFDRAGNRIRWHREGVTGLFEPGFDCLIRHARRKTDHRDV